MVIEGTFHIFSFVNSSDVLFVVCYFFYYFFSFEKNVTVLQSDFESDLVFLKVQN